MIHFQLKINDLQSIHEISDYWSDEDYMTLLEEFNYPDAKDANPAELRELLEMAINDFEPNESAEILLRYKLKDVLTNGQIKNLSHEMADDNESEEYPDIALHYPLFNINQLLHQAYNGKFPNAKATILDFELSLKEATSLEATKELALKALSHILSDKNPILRLFENQLRGKEKFLDAEKIIWELHTAGPNQYSIITSDYWINKDDIVETELSGKVVRFEEKKD